MPASATRLWLLRLNATQEAVREAERLLEVPAPAPDPPFSAAGLVADRDPRVAPRMPKVDRDSGRGQQEAVSQPHRVDAVDLHASNLQLVRLIGQVAKSLREARRNWFVVRAGTIGGRIRPVRRGEALAAISVRFESSQQPAQAFRRGLSTIGILRESGTRGRRAPLACRSALQGQARHGSSCAIADPSTARLRVSVGRGELPP